MKTSIILLLCLTTVLAAEYEYQDGVAVLTGDNIKQFIDENELSFIDFDTAWCGQCQLLTPHFAKTAQNLAKTHPHVKLGKINVDAHQAAVQMFDIKHIPTLYLFKKGHPESPILYYSERQSHNLLPWIKKQIGNVSLPIHSVQDAESLVEDTHVLAFFFGPADSASYKTYLSAIENMPHIEFAHSHSPDLLKHYNVSGEGLIIFKKFDEGRNIFGGAFDDENSVVDFLKRYSSLSVVEFTSAIGYNIFVQNSPALILITNGTENNKQIEEEFRKGAVNVRGEMIATIANINTHEGQNLANDLVILKEDLPAVRVFHTSSEGTVKYALEKEITAENIASFVEDCKQGKVPIFYRSEPLPTQEYFSDVKTVVGKNHDEVILNPGTEVFILYYDPQSDPYLEIAEAYHNFAKRMRNTPEFVVAKMDYTRNEANVKIYRGYNTINLYRKDSKVPINYSGLLSERGFYEFVKEKTRVKIPYVSVLDL